MSCRVRKADKRQLPRRNVGPQRRSPQARSWQDRLYDWRKRNDFSQIDAAMKLQISPRTLQEWEQGRARPRHLALIAINKIISR
jgi:DNA-binding transcriptional regulator YiaG